VAGGAADYRLVYSMHWPALDRRSRERGEEVARARLVLALFFLQLY
jgi:hypothetical protein